MNRKRILLLDDDPQVRFNLKLYFEDEGFECDAFENSESALNALKENSFDVAIVDIRLPGIDGEDFISASFLLAPEMKYIIHTGSTQYKLPEKLIAPGIPIEGIFNKPVSNMNLITEKINKLLE
jgi:DNA-binding NtrC family response regulator